MENHTAINENIILKVFLVNSYNKTHCHQRQKLNSFSTLRQILLLYTKGPGDKVCPWVTVLCPRINCQGAKKVVQK